MPHDSGSHDDYEIPTHWPAGEVVNWINATLTEPDVDSIEVYRKSGKIWFRVHYR